MTQNWLLLYIVFTILTLLNKYQFYSEFGINIVNYISLSEVPTLMFGEQIRLFERLGLNFVLYLWAIIAVSKLVSLISYARSQIKAFKESGPLSTDSLGVILFGSLSVFIIESFLASRIEVINTVEFFSFSILFGLMFGKVVNNYQVAVGFLFLAVLFFYLGASERADLVKKSKKHIEIDFTDKSKLVTGQNVKYVGETHDYLFVYNSSDSTSMTIRRENVSSIRFEARPIRNTFIDLLSDPYLVE